MELRELKYFLAVAREESILKASEKLYVSQPNLSRQMKGLEEELGQQLFLRGSRKITLTEAGELLKKRAEELLELYEKTRAELSSPITEVAGDVWIGGGESHAMRLIARTAQTVHRKFPDVHVRLFSGDVAGTTEKLDKGLLDFGVLIEPADLSKYDSLRLPLTDTWGVLMRRDSLLAERDFVTPKDLWDKPLICSEHSLEKSMISDWFQKKVGELNVIGTYNLLYNASLLVREGFGYAVCLDKIIPSDEEITFRPLFPQVVSHLDLVRKKNQIFPKCCEVFLKELKSILDLPSMKQCN